jgi:regulator of protease activity HflC (stomatin/prohibitin superfamily)
MNVSSFLNTAAFFAWVGFFAVLLLMFTRSRKQSSVRPLLPIAVVLIAAAVLLSAAGAGIVFINPEERGVVISAISPKGYRERPLQPGLNWIVPFLEYVERYPISRQTYTMSSAASEGERVGDDSIRARTKDGQEVYIDCSVIFSVDPERVIDLHITWQNRYAEELVRPLVRGLVRDMASQYGVEEIVSAKRAELESRITEELSKKFHDNNLILADFVLRNIHFTEEYAKAVEQKQIAEQMALQARFVVEQKKQEAEQARQIAQGQADAAVIKAKGEAEARLIQAEAEAKALATIEEVLRNHPELLQYLYILKLSPSIQTLILPSNAPFILPLPSMTPTPAPAP